MDSTAGIEVLRGRTTGLERASRKDSTRKSQIPSERKAHYQWGREGKTVWRWHAVVTRAGKGWEMSKQSRQSLGRRAGA